VQCVEDGAIDVGELLDELKEILIDLKAHSVQRLELLKALRTESFNWEPFLLEAIR
jgi:hypothetical protein